MDPEVGQAFLDWRRMSPFYQQTDWVFASPDMEGKQPYWPETPPRCYVHSAAKRAGIAKAPNGIAEIPLTPLAIEAFKSQMLISGIAPFLFPSDKNPSGHQKNLKTAWRKTLKRAGVPYFRIYDLRSTYATRLSAGGVADEWVTQLLRQGDAKVFKKYSQMKLQMKREALEKMNRQANEMPLDSGTATIQ